MGLTIGVNEFLDNWRKKTFDPVTYCDLQTGEVKKSGRLKFIEFILYDRMIVARYEHGCQIIVCQFESLILNLSDQEVRNYEKRNFI